MTRPLEKFQQLLRELFQFEDAAELDFGIYRIMKLRRERMEQWLTVDLPARAKEIIKGSSSNFDDDLAQRLEGLRTQLQAVQHDAIDADGNLVALETSDAGMEYAKLRGQQRRAPLRSTADIEILVYNNLYDFFSRYYDAGDFMAKRRWSFAPDGRDTYAVPWNGEEVVLHWANKDQYYIKTGERFTHYRWESVIGERTFKIEFQLTNADLPANNNKDAKKKFYLPVLDKIVWDEVTATLIVPFHWRGLFPQDQIEAKQEEKIRQNVNDATRERLLVHAAVTAVPHLVTALMAPKKDAAGNTIRDKDDNPVPLLRYHLNRWTRKNESDFFIHKDLHRFLAGELDYFIKSAVLNLDNLLAAGELRAAPNFRLLEAVKKLGTEIIDFLAQLENFQKALFEKKKFIVETSWCLTLDRIPGLFKDEVFAATLGNDRQWEEWEKLYKFSAMRSDLITPQLRTREFLEAFPYLMLDTALGYDRALVEKLIGGIENLDEQTDGLIIHSENFQALNLLQEQYREAVRCVYIDPPYNTAAAPITYKNNFWHSSWLSLVASRISKALPLMESDALFCVTIDDAEAYRLRALCDALLGERELFGVVCIKNNPAGRTGTVGFAVAHEYAFFYGNPSTSAIGRLEHSETQKARYKESDDLGTFEWTNFRKHGGLNTYRTERPRQFYPIYVKGDSVRIPKMTWDDRLRDWIIEEQPRKGEEVLLPIDSQGRERIWDFGAETAQANLSHFSVRKDSRNQTAIYRKWRIHEEGLLPLTWWDKSVYSAPEYGTNLLTRMFGVTHTFTFPKSVHAVADCLKVGGLKQDEEGLCLDYFAGSGTTGHAVINLNRSDGGLRKYVLVEMGDYFDAVLKPRLLKSVFRKTGKMVFQSRRTTPTIATIHITVCLIVSNCCVWRTTRMRWTTSSSIGAQRRARGCRLNSVAITNCATRWIGKAANARRVWRSRNWKHRSNTHSRCDARTAPRL